MSNSDKLSEIKGQLSEMGDINTLDPTSEEAGVYVQGLLRGPVPPSYNDLEKDAVIGIQKARKQIENLKETLQKEVIRVEKQIEYHQGEFNAYFIQLISEENRRRKSEE